MPGELSAFSIFVIAVVVVAIILVFMGVKSVPQGMEYTTERFGRYTRTLRPGLNLIMPIIDKVGAQMNMMETVLDVPSPRLFCYFRKCCCIRLQSWGCSNCFFR